MPHFIAAHLFRWLLVAGIVLTVPINASGGFVGAAFAQDDDDGGGDDDDDDDDDGGGFSGGGGGNGGGERATTPRQGTTARRAAVVRAPAPAPPPPDRAPDEIIVVDLSQADLDALLARGYTLIETRSPTLVAVVSQRLRIPPDTALDDARTEVRALPTGSTADFNHYYRTDQDVAPPCTGPHCAGFELVGWADPDQAPGCGTDARIGLIDTGINPDHEAFVGGNLTLLSAVPEDLRKSGAQHGTAVAAILIGKADSRSPGLVPQASVIAVDAFHRVGGDERSDAFSLVDAMDQLAVQEVDVINMSLSGPANTVLEQMVTRLTERGVVIVAAAGNDGPRADPVFPGAYQPVLTVTAVDRNGSVYRRAGQGAHVDLAAPGVEVWTAASVRGARGKTGTSFAAPFVTAAVAMLLAKRGDMTVEEVTLALTGTASDLGDPGRDDVFGAGLVRLDKVCNGAAKDASFVE